MIYNPKNIYETHNDSETGGAVNLYADVSPRGIYTGKDEPCAVENSLVFQLHSAVDHEWILYNDNAGTAYEFQPIEKAVPVEGLTMIYFTFPLGDSEGCLTSVDFFRKIQIYCPEPFMAAAAGENSLVLYPKTTIRFSFYDIAELRIGNLMTTKPAGNCPLCRITMFSPDRDEGIALNPLPVYILRHPLKIAAFEADMECNPAGFGDRIRFRYQVLGADTCVFTPGDTVLEAEDARQENEVYTAVLYRRTQYTLTAFCGGEQVSASVELVPMKAAIKNFTAEVTSPVKDDRREITFQFTVENTHHVYLSVIGRIEVKAGVEQKISRMFDCSQQQFTLSVENEDGLLQKTCVVVDAPPTIRPFSVN